jgi:hypothetical protein
MAEKSADQLLKEALGFMRRGTHLDMAEENIEKVIEMIGKQSAEKESTLATRSSDFEADGTL